MRRAYQGINEKVVASLEEYERMRLHPSDAAATRNDVEQVRTAVGELKSVAESAQETGASC